MQSLFPAILMLAFLGGAFWLNKRREARIASGEYDTYDGSSDTDFDETDDNNSDSDSDSSDSDSSSDGGGDSGGDGGGSD